jgi:tRNA pseudouridine55 synthase
VTDPYGFLLLDKPQGWSSHRVVSRVRKWLGTRKVGHAGTLDPMATGLLVIGIGPATRLLTHAVGLDKTYSATIRLGASTPTDDADSAPDRFAPAGAVETIDPDSLESALTSLRGDILQAPSAVSAIKVDGRRAYARVRAGEDVELAARPVTVSRFDVVSELRAAQTEDDKGNGHPVLDVDVVVDCSSGTYIRALARDLGAALGVHGHLTRLRRTRVGDYLVEDALAVPDFDAEAPLPSLLPAAQAAAGLLPVLPVTEDQARDLRMGRRIPAAGSADEMRAAVSGDDLVAIVDLHTGEAAPRTVFPAHG